MHCTVGKNIGLYGDRTSSVWVSHGRQLHICSAVNGYDDYCYEHKNITNSWSKIRISQRPMNNFYLYEIEVDGIVVHSVQNFMAEEFKDVKCYASDPWHHATDGEIQKLTILTKPGIRQFRFLVCMHDM